MLTRDAILAARKLRVEKVEVPELGGHVFVREMTCAERDDYEGRSIVAAKGKSEAARYRGVRARMVAASVCDESGTLLFSPDDEAAINALPLAAFQRIYNVAAPLNRLSDSDAEDLAGKS